MPRRRHGKSSWRALADALRARGIARRPDDTSETMAARVQGADAPARQSSPVRLVPALTGPPGALDHLAPTITRFGGRRVAPDVVLVPGNRVAALRRALRRGRHLALVVEPRLAVPEVDAAVWAIVQFVRGLPDALGWPVELVPPELALVPPPTDPVLRWRAQLLSRAWTAALDAWVDSLAELRVDRDRPHQEMSADQVRHVLRQALQESRCVRLTYWTAGRNAVNRRTVEPRALEKRWGSVYLRAYCRWRQDERLFRLDRILRADLEAERFGEPAVEPPAPERSDDRRRRRR